ncbi:2-phospho-L-lactate guanylyltransferase [Candidatus Mycalebacterium sp.]
MKAVVVPVKRFSAANERLCEVLSPSERKGLARVMLEDVLSNVARCECADGVFLVTAEPDAMSMGRGFGMEIITERDQQSESLSVDFAMKKCFAAGVDSVLVVPGDIPAAQAWEFDAVLEKDDGGNRIIIVPSRDGTGTNALFMSPPGVLSPHFGENSFPRHREMALRLGLEFSSLALGGIGLDIDAPEDLEIFMSGNGTRTHDYLCKLGFGKTEKTA